MPNENLGQTIKYYRRLNQLTQKDLAGKLNLGQTAIANYEMNLRSPSHKTLIAMANIFNITLDNFVRASEASMLTLTPEEFKDIIIKDVNPDLIVFIKDLAQKGLSIFEIYSNYLKPVMYEVGRLWENGELTIVQEHQISRIVESMVDVVIPYNIPIVKTDRSVILTSLNSERHLIGLKMIAELFKYNGWKTYYLGNNTPWMSIRRLINLENIDLVIISSTYATEYNTLNGYVNYLKEQSSVKVIVGGQTIDNHVEWEKHIVADGYSKTEDDIKRIIHDFDQ